MKCIYCSHDADYNKRHSSGGRCFNCGRGYAFEPKTDVPKISDPFFHNAILRLSENNQLFFTERQLWYELNRALVRKEGGCFSAILIIMLFFLCILMGEEQYILTFIIGAGMVVSILYRQLRGSKTTVYKPPLSFSHFRENYLERWIKAHGRPDMLLNLDDYAPRLEKEKESDPSALGTFSFDQAVVTDSDEVAHLLVANNFHFDYKCAVLSLDGYPGDRADTILKMLRQNPNLIVFALHDASIEGCQTALRLREPKWFPDQQIKIVDLGMFPHHAQKMTLQPLTTEQTVPEKVQALLKPEEIKWLERGIKVELEALPPMRLIRIISRGMGLTKKMLEEYGAKGLALPIAAGLAGIGGLILLNEELFEEERKKNQENDQGGGGSVIDFGYADYDSWDDSWGDDYG